MKENYKKFDDSLQSLAQAFRKSVLNDTSKSKTNTDLICSTTDLKNLVDPSYDKNHKLQLLNALLYYDNWSLIKSFVRHVHPVRVASYPTICKTLCARADAIIYMLYEQTQNRQYDKPTSNFNITLANDFTELEETLFPTLYLIGPYLYTDPRVFKHVLIVVLESMKITVSL